MITIIRTVENNDEVEKDPPEENIRLLQGAGQHHGLLVVHVVI
jgi:hypothetical protein